MFFSHALRVGLDLWGVSPSYRGDVAHQIATRGRGDRVGAVSRSVHRRIAAGELVQGDERASDRTPERHQGREAEVAPGC